jgi:hypothetical protein
MVVTTMRTNTQRSLILIACALTIAVPVMAAAPVAVADPISEGGICVDLTPDTPTHPVDAYFCDTSPQP